MDKPLVDLTSGPARRLGSWTLMSRPAGGKWHLHNVERPPEGAARRLSLLRNQPMVGSGSGSGGVINASDRLFIESCFSPQATIAMTMAPPTYPSQT